MTRRKFVGVAMASGGAVAAGALSGLSKAATSNASAKTTFLLAGDLAVNRMGFLLR